MKPNAKMAAPRLPQNFRLEGVREICRLASGGNQVALALAWRGATELAQTILAVAEAKPERLKELAPFATYMPALLSRSKSFNKATARLAERANLAAALVASSRPDLRLDSLTTRFVVELLERFDGTRTQIQDSANAYRKQRQLRKMLRTLEVRTLEDYLLKHLDFSREDLRLLELGQLSEATAPDWWGKVFKPHLEDDYTMHTLRGTPLYKELRRCSKAQTTSRILAGFDGDRKLYKTVSTVKDYLVKDELKRRCQDALERLAKTLDSSKPPPGNR